ncbi:hypothetical protein DFH07DRAFT_966645 [Mycena maculata]|uniref:Uncharacterized protein n=1 Tax=Mycena maculata TaxID=230809 RepID=A0AAD7MZ01_9AGAR|nr:hypothetical protein DFH07DRAFT_966645 [Mycena maculata]
MSLLALFIAHRGQTPVTRVMVQVREVRNHVVCGHVAAKTLLSPMMEEQAELEPEEGLITRHVLIFCLTITIMQFPLIPRVNPFLGIPRDRNGALVTVSEYLAQGPDLVTYGAAASIEQAELRLKFESQYPYTHPDRLAETPSFLNDRAWLEARLGCSRAIWYIHDYCRIFNSYLIAVAQRDEAAAILAASAALFDDAVSELLTDEYLAAWHACPPWQVRSWGIAPAPVVSTAVVVPLPNATFPGVWGTGNGGGGGGWGTGAWVAGTGMGWGTGNGGSWGTGPDVSGVWVANTSGHSFAIHPSLAGGAF